MGGENYTPDHDIYYKFLDKINQDILLDYIWEHPVIMKKIKEWIKMTEDIHNLRGY